MEQIREALEKFKSLEITRDNLMDLIGKNLLQMRIDNPVCVKSQDVIKLLRYYLRNKIQKEELLNWVNTVWFTDLFEYNDVQSESIATVMNELEEADENDEKLSKEHISEYIKALETNQSYTRKEFPPSSKVEYKQCH